MAECYVDWSKIPEGKNYVAIDEDGDICYFKLKPYLSVGTISGRCVWAADNNGGDFWYPGDKVESSAVISSLPHFRDSLIQRPDATNAR